MAVQIPLNRFRRVSFPLLTTPRVMYTAPFGRAAILLTSLATNTTNTSQTVSMSISSANNITQYTWNIIDLVNTATIGGNDTANVTIGKIVLVEGDILLASCSSLSGIHLTLGILEAVNTD